jgi:protein-arginine kinase activator protein McsA
MDNGSIAGRVDRLRREIQLIQQGEHRYRSHRGHSPADKEDHLNREVRILQIREELRTLVERAKQRSSHGSVRYTAQK